MAKTITNVSSKVIGLGGITVLPNESAVIPVNYEANPALDVYVRNGLAVITGEATPVEVPFEEPDFDAEAEAAEELRKARLASLKGISEEGLASLANELGVNLAECKDQADVLKKVKLALKK